jgi:hypothetical protein
MQEAKHLTTSKLPPQSQSSSPSPSAPAANPPPYHHDYGTFHRPFQPTLPVVGPAYHDYHASPIGGCSCPGAITLDSRPFWFRDMTRCFGLFVGAQGSAARGSLPPRAPSSSRSSWRASPSESRPYRSAASASAGFCECSMYQGDTDRANTVRHVCLGQLTFGWG